MLQTKEEIAHDVKEQLTKSMSSFGFMIIQTLVTDIEPDMKVRAAMNEINAAQRMRCLLLSHCARDGDALFHVHRRIVKLATLGMDSTFMQHACSHRTA